MLQDRRNTQMARHGFFAFDGHGKRRVSPSLQENEARGRLGEASMKEPFPETDLCSVQSRREGKRGTVGRDPLGLTVRRVLVQPRGQAGHHLGKGKVEMIELDFAETNCL